MKPRFAAVISSLILLFTSFNLAASELVKSTPETVAGATTVDAVTAKQLFEEEAAFVDLRKLPAWNAGRIPGAIYLDFKNNFTKENLLAEVDVNEPVVFYCSGVRCPRSSKASKKAVSWGYKQVHYFREGYPAWKSAGYPIE